MTTGPASSPTSRHRGIVLVGGQDAAEIERIAQVIAGDASHLVTVGPDVQEGADDVHRLALDLARSGDRVDVVAALVPGTPLRASALLLGALVDSDLGRPSGECLLQHVVAGVSAVDLADLALRGVDDRFFAAEHVIELVEHATVVMLTDTAAVPPQDLQILERLLARLAPETAALRAEDLAPDSLSARGGAAQLGGAAGWMQALSEHTPDHHDDGTITTFVYRDERPFHPERLAAVVERTFAPGAVGTVLRSRGFTQFATRSDRVGSWSSVGQMLSLDPTSLPSWHPDSPHGQQIAFFGLDLDVAAIRRDLDTCLLTNDELLSDPASWRDLVDPFPVWDGHRHTH
jgi:hypothetical protein